MPWGDSALPPLDAHLAGERRHDIDDALDHVAAVIAEAEGAVRGGIDALLDCEQACQVCRACVAGMIDTRLDAAGSTVGKVDDRILRSIESHLGDSYYHAYEWLGPAPTIETVIAEILGEPIPPAPSPAPGPAPQLPTLPPPDGGGQTGPPPKPDFDCPKGQVWQFDQLLRQWKCVPGPQIEPRPQPGPTCNVIPPPAPGPGPDPWGGGIPMPPPCPPPTDITCPEGQEWRWDAHRSAWRCMPIGQDPAPDDDGGVCVADPEPVCVTRDSGPAIVYAMPDWSRPDVCAMIDQFVETAGQGVKTLAESIPWTYDEASRSYVVPPETRKWFNRLPIPARVFSYAIVAAPLSLVQKLVEIIGKAGGCMLGAIAWPLTVNGLLGLAERWLGVRAPWITRRYDQLANYQCPTELPGQGDLNHLYYGGLIDQPTWRCLTRANGQIDAWAERIRDQGRPTLTPDQLISAEFRGLLGQQGAAPLLHERYGLSAESIGLLRGVNRFIPTPPDIVTFMIRDVFDETVVERYGYDAEFREKFAGPALEWMQASGTDAEVAKYYWRAHWTLPSNTQLYTMLHRLRADSTDPEARALAIDRAEVERAMQINDIPQFWVSRLAQVSYLPMNRTELKNAYYLDAISRAEVISGLQNTGLSARDAELVARSYDQARRLRLQNLGHGLTPGRVSKMLRGGGLSDSDGEKLYIDAGLSPQQAIDAVRWVRVEYEAAQRARKVAMLKRRYMVGDFLPGAAASALLDIGVDVERADYLVREWEWEIQVRGKQVAAATLCEWRYRGLISDEEYGVRLRRIGYSPADVIRIVAACEAGSIERKFDREVKTIRGKKVIDDDRKRKQGADK